jgi:hypothetical protein
MEWQQKMGMRSKFEQASHWDDAICPLGHWDDRICPLGQLDFVKIWTRQWKLVRLFRSTLGTRVYSIDCTLVHDSK